MLSTSVLTGIQVYAPDDLYITAGSGTTLSEIQTFLGKKGRQVPLISPWPAATIGGMVAANLNSPQRMLYGSLRDQLLCATVALADGRVIRAGRPVVKNVAGYDLPKVLVGSFGTLGLMVDLTLKLMPLPRAKRTLLIPIEDLQQGLAMAGQLISRTLVASAIVLYKGAQLPGMPESPYMLACTAEGIPEDVDSELKQMSVIIERTNAAQPIQVLNPSGTDLWADLLASARSAALSIRIGLAAKDLTVFMRNQSSNMQVGSFLIDTANGLIYAVAEFDNLERANEWLNQLRRAALASGGYAVVTGMPSEWDGLIERWGYEPDSLHLMRALKARWDPNGILGAATFIVDSR